MKDSPLAVALTRGFWIAVLSVVAVGLTAYSKTHDPLLTAEICVAAATSVLSGRGLAEGSVDTLRAARAAQGDASAITPADVGAFSPPITTAAAPAKTLIVSDAPQRVVVSTPDESVHQ